MKTIPKYPYLILVLLAFFLAYFKLVRFEALAYFLDDFTNNLEGSYSWLIGRPLTFANGFGQLNTAHNYFLMPFLGPIALYFGAKGIFVFYILCNFILWLYVFKLTQNHNFSFLITFIFLFFNPTFLWIFDHPDVGWSVEMLYFPFAIMYAISLKLNLRYSIYVFAMLLMAVREEGIILVAMIHITFLILNLKNYKSIFYDKKLWLFGIAYTLLFGVSMVYLASKGNSNSFVESAFSILKLHFNDINFHLTNFAYLGQAILLIFPFILFYISFQKFNLPHFLFYLLFLFLLFALTFFQTIRYYDKFYFQIVSITWAIRFILPFTFTIAFLALNFNPKQVNFQLSKFKFGLILILFLVQFLFISFIRQDVSYKQLLSTLITHKPQHRMQELLQEVDIEYIKKIEKAMPARSSIYIGDYLVPIFTNHFIVWPDRYKEFEKADIAIIPRGEAHIHLKNELPLIMKNNYKIVQTFGAYEVYATPEYSKYLMIK